MNIKKKCYTIKLFACFQAIFLMLCNFSYGQLNFQTKHYSTEDGLSHEKVTSILKDREGFMWFGTWDGIDRFDGHNFITFKSYAGDNSNLKSNRIVEIVEDYAGSLWVRADDKQVYRFDKKTGHFFSSLKIFGADTSIRYLCSKIIASQNGSIWLLSEKQGVVLVSKPYNQSPVITKYAAELNGNYHLPSNQINFFHEDKQHNIWIGTTNGLVHLLAGPFSNYVPAPLNQQYCVGCNFTSTYEDDNGIVFTSKEGFVTLHDKISRKFTNIQFPQKGGLNGVCLSHNSGLIYCTTGAGELLVLNRTNLKLLTTIKIDTKPIFSVYEDHLSSLWIEPKDNGVFKYDPSGKKIKYFTHKIYSSTNTGTPYSVFEDAKGYTWVNMKGHGFGYYNADRGTIDPFYNDPNFEDYQFSNKVIHQYYDPAGILWLSTENRGLEKIVMLDNNFHQKLLVPHTFIKSENEVRAIYYDRENRLWVATKENLCTFLAGKKISKLFINEPMGGLGHVYSICEDHKGNLWLGTKGGGLYKAIPVNHIKTKYRLTNYLNNAHDPYSISSNIIYSVIEDKNGRIWAGTHGGGINLVVTEKNETQFYNASNVFKNYPKRAYMQIRHLATDLTGNIWIGTTDGVLILDPANGDVRKFRFKSYSKITGNKESLGNNDVQFIYKDKAAQMWLCTSGGGLNLAIGKNPFLDLKFKAFTIKNGLSNDFTLSCIEDNNGNLWVATQKGISEFNIFLKRFKNYDSNDGLPQTGFSEGCCLKLPDGNLIFGAFTGYLQFKPDALIDQKINAPIALTNLEIDGKQINVSDEQQRILKSDINNVPHLTLNYDQNDLNLMFSILDYRASNRQACSYRLLGLDTAWTLNDRNNLKVNYSNLPPGDYIFQVRIDNEGQYFGTPYKQLSITILPPPWRTWWACIIYVIIGITALELSRRIIFTMLKLRQRIAVEQHLTELKLNFFTNISHELRTPLTLILNPISAITRNEPLSAQGKEYARMIMKNANRMVRFMNQFLDLRKIQSGKASLRITEVEVLTFIKNIASHFNEPGKENGIKLTIKSNVTKLYAWMDTEKLDIVIYNLLSNAYKFSEDGKEIIVSVEEDIAANCFRMKFIDQGIGVAKEDLENIFALYFEGHKTTNYSQKGTGIGLALAKELILLHQGIIFAENNDVQGLTVTIEMKLGKAHFIAPNVEFLPDTEPQIVFDNHLSETYISPNGVLNNQCTTDVTNPQVLIVEDNRDLRYFLAAQLSEFYRVIEAENGEEGYRKALSSEPDLIISDIMMPVMSGIQMLDKLKNHIATSHIPVILLSAKYSVDNQIEGINYGADLYITKPFHNDFLIASIAGLIKQRKNLFEAIINGAKMTGLSKPESIITPKDEEFLKKVIQVVGDGMSDPNFNIDDFADAFGMSRSVFFRKFKSLTNSTPVEFVRNMRVKKGKQLLDEGETNIAQVAYSVGFNDAKYFGTCFKKQYNYTPSEYLKSPH